MKKIILFTILLTLIFSTGCSLKQTNTAISHPTKEEWLEIYLTHKIEDVTDLWRLRTTTKVGIYNEDKEIVVIITTSNGEDYPNKGSQQVYTETAEGVVEEIIKSYEWAKNYKIIVDFI